MSTARDGGEPNRNREPVLLVIFFRTELGNEPVREWLKALDREDRKVIGEDIKTAQFGWPIGMPLVRKLMPDLWEVRSRLRQGIARVIFLRSKIKRWCYCTAS